MAVDLNERALRQENKKFISFCSAAYIIDLIALLVTILAAVLSVTACIVVYADGSNAQAMEKYEIFGVIRSVAIYIGIGIALKHGESVFKKLKSGETPFRYDIADKIKAMGIALIAAEAVGLLVEAVKNILVLVGALNAELGVSVELGMLLCGFILCALAYIFNYGCKLQQEADGTV